MTGPVRRGPTRPPPPTHPSVATSVQRHVLVGDLEWLEYAIADYVAKWGEHWTGRPYLDPEFGVNLAGMPVAVANMAMTVIRKNLAPAGSGRLADAVVDAAVAETHAEHAATATTTALTAPNQSPALTAAGDAHRAVQAARTTRRNAVEHLLNTGETPP